MKNHIKIKQIPNLIFKIKQPDLMTLDKKKIISFENIKNGDEFATEIKNRIVSDIFGIIDIENMSDKEKIILAIGVTIGKKESEKLRRKIK